MKSRGVLSVFTALFDSRVAGGSVGCVVEGSNNVYPLVTLKFSQGIGVDDANLAVLPDDARRLAHMLADAADYLEGKK